MEFIKNLFKALFKKKHKEPEIIVNWEKGTMVIKSDKELSPKEIAELVNKAIMDKENDKNN